jgi:hypothetical protein
MPRSRAATVRNHPFSGSNGPIAFGSTVVAPGAPARAVAGNLTTARTTPFDGCEDGVERDHHVAAGVLITRDRKQDAGASSNPGRVLIHILGWASAGRWTPVMPGYRLVSAELPSGATEVRPLRANEIDPDSQSRTTWHALATRVNLSLELIERRFA